MKKLMGKNYIGKERNAVLLLCFLGAVCLYAISVHSKADSTRVDHLCIGDLDMNFSRPHVLASQETFGYDSIFDGKCSLPLFSFERVIEGKRFLAATVGMGRSLIVGYKLPIAERNEERWELLVSRLHHIGFEYTGDTGTVVKTKGYMNFHNGEGTLELVDGGHWGSQGVLWAIYTSGKDIVDE